MRHLTNLTLTLLLAACSADPDSDGVGADTSVADGSGSGSGSADTSDDVADISDSSDGSGSGEGSGSGAAVPDLLDQPTVFGLGCAPAGRSAASVIPDGAPKLSGYSALGGPGDVVLYNGTAAFVFQRVDTAPRTYWYYGGQPIDAVAIANCAQDGPERFDEMGFILGKARLDSFEQSVLRGFKAERLEVLSDGSDGGAARVRATGTDDFFWLIELELIERAHVAGNSHGYSQPLGFDFQVDYILDPGSPVLRIELTATNRNAARADLVAGMVNFFGDTSSRANYNDNSLGIGGIGVAVGVPWLGSVSRDHALAIGMLNAQPGLVSISGVDALVNINQFLSGAALAAGASRTDTFFLSVGAHGLNSAVMPLQRYLPRPYTGANWTAEPVTVRAVDGAGVSAGPVEVVVEMRNGAGAWLPISSFWTDEEGTFTGEIPKFGIKARRLRAVGEGRGASQTFDLTGAAEPIALVFGDRGSVRVDVRDEAGASMPARVTFWQGDALVAETFAGTAPSDFPLPVGDYTVAVARGFEFELIEQPISVTVDGAELSLTLRRLLDTTGFLSMDGHVHAGPSPDSSVTIADRAISLAAENVEVGVSTDHEAIVPWSSTFADNGLNPWVRTVLGEEVTAPFPEHSNAYPFPSRVTEAAPRGEPVDWRYKDMPGLFQASRDRGAQVVGLNHPRLGCGWMCVVEYNRITGLPDLADPTLLGYPADAQLWGWNFDTVEVMNDHSRIWNDPANPRESGLWDDWLSFLNHGHAITGVGVTDVHSPVTGGSPRTYFAAPTDDVSAFNDQMLVDAMLSGKAMVSSGAFGRLSANGATLGETAVAGPGGLVRLQLQVQALPQIDVVGIQVFANCDEVAWVATTNPNGLVKFDGAIDITVPADAHIVVAAHGLNRLPRPFPQFEASNVPRLFTNPIYIDAEGDGYNAVGGKSCTYSLVTDHASTGRRAAPAPLTSAVPRLYPDYPHNDGCHPAHD